jgi:tRNA A-37 threonylcarbamoyl transferase component Bud32
MSANLKSLSSLPERPETLLAGLRAELSVFRWEASRYRSDLTLPGWLAELRDCRLVKTNRRRRVFELQTPRQGYFLKIATVRPAVHGWGVLLRRARRWAEWHNLNRLIDRGLAACTPVLRGQGAGRLAPDFFLVTEKVEGLPPGEGLQTPAGALGHYLAALHRAGVYAADLHPQNLLLRPDGSVCLIDAQEVFFLPRLPRRLRVNNLGKLLHYLGTDAQPLPEWWDAFLEAYHRAGAGRVSAEETRRAAARFDRRRRRSRSKRCCVDGSEFEVVRGAGYRRRGFAVGPEEIGRIFENGRPLKDSHIREAQGLCIKTRRRVWLHRDRCLTGWKMSHALSVRGIPVARALACYRVRGCSYLVSEYLEGGRPLNECLSALAGPALRRRLAELAGWLRRIHAAEVWQHDFKSANVLCGPDRFYLLDLEGVRLGRLSRRRIIVNLAQLNASVSHAVGLKDRLRFYRYYTQGADPPRRQRRAEYRAIWEITTTKNTAASGLDLKRLMPGRAFIRRPATGG